MKLYLVLLILCILFLSGCSDGVTYFDSSDSAQCTIQCKQKIKKNWCDRGYSNFGSMCRCIMLDCIKNVETEKQPENYTDFRIKSTSTISQSNKIHHQDCYQNGKKVNCTEIIDIDEFISLAKDEK